MLQCISISPRLCALGKHNQHRVHVGRQERNHFEKIRAWFSRRGIHAGRSKWNRRVASESGGIAPLLSWHGSRLRHPIVLGHLEEVIQLGRDDRVDPALRKLEGGFKGLSGLKCDHASTSGIGAGSGSRSDPISTLGALSLPTPHTGVSSEPSPARRMRSQNARY
jgi:hypothetical protein